MAGVDGLGETLGSRGVENVTLLKVEDLKTYFLTRAGDVKAVDGVSFEMDRDEALGLAGESGCGKTTAALSIMRLLPSPGRIQGGRIIFDGKDLVQMDEDEIKNVRWKEISIVFQGAMNALNPVLTVGRQIVEAILAHEETTKEEAWNRAEELLELVGISSQRVREYPHEFSGGMRQRAMIAMALACNPKLVIADEPVTALDVIVQAQILKLLRTLRDKLHLSTILITHDLSVIADFCDNTAIMYAGKIVEYGDVMTIFREPVHPYTQALMGAFPSLRGEDITLLSLPGAPPPLIDPPSGCRFHPRCQRAMEICSRKEPEYIEIKSGHFSACHQCT
ncbi:MAG: ABC transporter ATP-binding protein [Candidatus Bathyarchaeota archaeon]|nr:ABC transporter ATP-binding protein [Candidatus Bathyarchaeota archaeon]